MSILMFIITIAITMMWTGKNGLVSTLLFLTLNFIKNSKKTLLNYKKEENFIKGDW